MAEPTRRVGRIPERETRVYLLVDGLTDEQPTLDLHFYLNRLQDSVLPVVALNDEVIRAVELCENELETVLGRLKSLSPETMRSIVQAIITEHLPKSVHPRMY